MRQIVIILFLVLSCFTTPAQTNQPASSLGRHEFLPVSNTGTIVADEQSGSLLAAGVNSLASNGGTNAPVEEIALDDKHKLLAGDRLTFHIQEDRIFEYRTRDQPRDPNAPTQLLLSVTDSGELNVPYIGLVTVGGKTCREAAAEIRKLLEKDYYYKATVVLGLDQATKVVGHYYIYGYIKNPGGFVLPLDQTLTVGKAISLAGGFSDFASKKDVKIIRTVDGQKQTMEVNLVDILEKGRIEKDVPLLPDDYIYVGKKFINW
jgi:polysaccharide export outer membrane protein